MRLHSRLAHRRRTWYARRYGRWAAFAAALALAPAALSAQTITATIPDSIALGDTVTVKLEARDVLGRIVPKPRGRVFVTCDSPTIVSAAVDRLTAHAADSTVCRALWDRYDYARIEVSRLVRVYAPAVVPVDTAPTQPPVDSTPALPLTVVTLTISPETTVTLDSAGASRSLSVWGRVSVDGVVRVAQTGELPPLTWSASGPAVTVNSNGGIWGAVTAQAIGTATVSACAGEVCGYRAVVVGVSPPEIVGAEPCRPLVATDLARVDADTAFFVRALPGLPAVRYCVDDRLAVVLEGDLVTDGEPGTGSVTTLYFPPGVVLPVVVP